MFSPPVGGSSGGGSAMKGGPPNVDSSQLYHQGYKPGQSRANKYSERVGLGFYCPFNRSYKEVESTYKKKKNKKKKLGADEIQSDLV